MYLYIYTHVCTNRHICMFYFCVYIYMYTYEFIYIHVCACVFIFICKYVHMHICIREGDCGNSEAAVRETAGFYEESSSHSGLRAASHLGAESDQNSPRQGLHIPNVTLGKVLGPFKRAALKGIYIYLYMDTCNHPEVERIWGIQEIY